MRRADFDSWEDWWVNKRATARGWVAAVLVRLAFWVEIEDDEASFLCYMATESLRVPKRSPRLGTLLLSEEDYRCVLCYLPGAEQTRYLCADESERAAMRRQLWPDEKKNAAP